MFSCDSCGSCCRHLDLSEIYIDLDRGDGVCKFLNGNKCSIYYERPLYCRIDESFHIFFEEVMERNEYDRLNSQMCKKLKEMEE